MNAVWAYLLANPMFAIIVLGIVGYGLSRVLSWANSDVDNAPPVPHYRRLDRREPEFGDRRKTEIPPEEEKRQQDGRRAKD